MRISDVYGIKNRDSHFINPNQESLRLCELKDQAVLEFVKKAPNAQNNRFYVKLEISQLKSSFGQGIVTDGMVHGIYDLRSPNSVLVIGVYTTNKAVTDNQGGAAGIHADGSTVTTTY